MNRRNVEISIDMNESTTNFINRSAQSFASATYNETKPDCFAGHRTRLSFHTNVKTPEPVHVRIKYQTTCLHTTQ